MGAGHAHPLYLPGSSAVHRLPAEVKIVAAFLGVLCVVATPREAVPVFGGYLLVLVAVWVAAGIPIRWIAVRSLIEAPFVVLAVLLPFTGPPPTVEWIGLALSEPGLLGAWNILVKGALGVLTSLTLAATTPLRDLLLGLQRLGAPPLVVTIATLMLRYVDVIAGEARRMRLARISRGHDPRFLWQLGATARGVGPVGCRGCRTPRRPHGSGRSGWSPPWPRSHWPSPVG